MSIHHLEAAAELELHATSKLVFMALCDDANKITRITFPGMEKLVQWSGAKPRRVQDIIEQLIVDKHLARRKSGQPGRKAEFLVFPTDEEIAQLAAKKAAEIAAKNGTRKPVDNSEDVGAAQCTHSDNGCTLEQNACTPECVPPVRPPLDLTQSSITGSSSGSVDNSTATENSSPTPPAAPKPAPLPREKPLDLGKLQNVTSHVFAGTDLDQADLATIARRILAKSPTRVLDETAYVSSAIRRESHYWQQQAFDMTTAGTLVAAETAGNPF